MAPQKTAAECQKSKWKNKRQQLISSPQGTGSPAYKSRSAEAKATKKIECNSPQSPTKKSSV